MSYAIDLEKNSSQYLSVADTANLSPTGSFCIEAWINPESQPSSGDYVIASKYSNVGTAKSFVFNYSDSAGTKKLRLYHSTNGGTLHSAEVTITALTLGLYSHVAVVFTTGTPIAEFFVNGVSQGTNAGDLTAGTYDSATDFRIGAYEDTGPTYVSFFDGLIDEVRLWNTTRTAAQLLANYTSEISSQAGLVGYWKLNSDLTDSSGNGATLTANGGAATYAMGFPPFLQEISGTPVETVTLIKTQAVSLSDIAGVPVDTVDADYGWGNQSLPSTTWTNQSL